MSELTAIRSRRVPATDGAATRATLVGCAALALWSSLALLTVHARGVPSFELEALSFGVAFLAGLAGLAVLALRGPTALRQLRQPLVPWLTAFLGIFMYHALYFYALSAAPAAQASLISYLWPLLIVLLAAGSGDGLRARHLGGALLGLMGTGLVMLGPGARSMQFGAATGYAAALGSAVVWAGYSVLNRRFGSTPSTVLVGVCGAVSLAGAACHLAFEPTVRPDTEQLLAIVALGLGPTGLAFFAWDHATKHGRLGVLGALSYLAPLASTLLLVATGRVEASGLLLLAAILVIGGAVLATSRQRNE
jgi:drug/metabolite transporter (DMT)-like permease